MSGYWPVFRQTSQITRASSTRDICCAYLLDWHYREDKAVWWEYFRLLELPERELEDEPAVVARLKFVAELGPLKKSVIARYAYPAQEIEIRDGDELKLQDKQAWGTVHAHDRAARTIDVIVGPKKRALRPTSAFVHKWIDPKQIHQSLMRRAERVLSGDASKLLLGIAPAALATTLQPGETSATDFAVRLVRTMHEDVLAIQGPPGTGKTFTGARMIAALITDGKRVGVTAQSHKVIRNLLDAVAEQLPASCRSSMSSPSVCLNRRMTTLGLWKSMTTTRRASG